MADLFRPRLLPLILALLTATAAASALNRKLDPAAFSTLPVTAVLASRTDDITAAAHTALARSAGPSPAILLVGASAMREAVVTEQPLRAVLQGRTGADVDVIRLASSGQTMTESLALLTTVQAAPGSVVLLHVSAGRLNQTRETALGELKSPRLPLIDYTRVKRLLGKSSLDFVPALLRYRSWTTRYLDSRLDRAVYECASRLKRLSLDQQCATRLRSGPWLSKIDAAPGSIYQDTALPISEKRELTSLAAHQFAAAPSNNTDFNVSVLREIAALARERRWHLMLVQFPVDPLTREVERGYWHGQRKTIESNIASDVVLLDWFDDPQFASNDFYDLHHLRPRGREKLLAHLTEPVALALTQ